MDVFFAQNTNCEEKERRAREQARRAAARGYGGGSYDGGGYGPDGTWEGEGWPGREPPPPRFSPVQIVLGSTGFLFALLALLFKTIDNNRAHAILSTFGLGHLVPKKIETAEDSAAAARRRYCIDQKRRKWPPENVPKED